MSRQLSDPIDGLDGYFACGELAVLAPRQANMGVALGTLGTPAVGFATARIDLSKRAAEQRLILEELIQ